MIYRTLALAALVATLVAPGVALAGPTCTNEPKAKWMSEDAMKAKIDQMGYNRIELFKATSGSCYEIYAYSSDGKKVEVYFHPITGAVVESLLRK